MIRQTASVLHGLGVLREGQQGRPFASGWRLPHNGNHLLIIQFQAAHGIEE